MKGVLKMKLLEDRILRDGQVRPGNVLKVDCFLNHQLDVDLLDKIGEEFYRIFKDDGVNKVLTIEASGIAIACMTARHFDVPVVFAKKAKSKNIDGDVYTSTVHSYTYGKDYNITLAQKFLGPNDRVLILDDFLANGKAMRYNTPSYGSAFLPALHTWGHGSRIRRLVLRHALRIGLGVYGLLLGIRLFQVLP